MVSKRVIFEAFLLKTKSNEDPIKSNEVMPESGGCHGGGGFASGNRTITISPGYAVSFWRTQTVTPRMSVTHRLTVKHVPLRERISRAEAKKTAAHQVKNPKACPGASGQDGGLKITCS